MCSSASVIRRSTIAAVIALAVITTFGVAVADNKPVFLPQHSNLSRVTKASFSANSQLLALCGDNGIVDIWDTRSWTLIRTFQFEVPEYPGSPDVSCIISPDGSKLAYVSTAGTVQLWDISTGTRLATLPGNARWSDIAWSANGKVIAVSDEVTYLWDVKQGKTIRTINADGDPALSADGKVVAVTNWEIAALYDVSTGRKLQTLKDKSQIRSPVAFSPDGKLIATGGEDPDWTGPEYELESASDHQLKVKIWDRRTGKLLKILPGHMSGSRGTQTFQFTPDSRRLFSGGWGSWLWDVRTGKAVKTFNTGYECAMSPDGKLIFNPVDALDIISAQMGKRIKRLPNKPFCVTALAFSADGRYLASGEQSGIRLWDVKTKAMIRAFPEPSSSPHDIKYLHGGRILSNGFYGIYIWNQSSGKLLKKLQGPIEKEELDHAYRKQALLTPDGALMVSESGGSFPDTYKVWDASNQQVLYTLPAGISGRLHEAAFSPDGRYMAVRRLEHQMNQNVAVVWDLKTGEKESEIITETDVMAMEFSPDGTVIAGSFYNKGIAFFDRKSGKMIREIKLEKSAIRHMAYSADGKVLAAALEGDILLYNPSSGEKIGVIHTKGQPITALAASPDGKFISTGDELGNARLWDTKERKLLITMVGFPGKDKGKISHDWYTYTPSGFYNWSKGADKLIKWRKDSKIYPASTLKK